MVLTARQQEDLHRSILGYLHTHNHTTAEADLSQAWQLSPLTDPQQIEQYAQQLEKKWLSIVKLQRRVMELEQQNTALNEEIKHLHLNGSAANGTASTNGMHISVESPTADATAGTSSTKGLSSWRQRTNEYMESLPRAPAVQTLTGHRAAINRVIFHPHYTLLLTCSDDNTIKVYDYESYTYERTLAGHTDSVNDIDISSNGQLLISASSDCSLKLWSLQSLIQHQQQDTESNNSKRNLCIRTLNGHDHRVSSCRFTPAGDLLISGSRDKSVKVWQVETGFCIKTLYGHDDWVKAVRVNADHTLYASASADRTIRLWNTASGDSVHTLAGHEHVVECLIFSTPAADKHITAALNEAAGISSLKTITNSISGLRSKRGTMNGSLKPNMFNLGDTVQSSPTNAAAISSQYILSGGRDKLIKIWRTETGECVRTLAVHDNWIRDIVIHPSGRYILSCSDDKTIRILDITKSFKCIRVLDGIHSQFVTSIAYCPKLPLLATSSTDSTVKILECKPYITHAPLEQQSTPTNNARSLEPT